MGLAATAGVLCAALILVLTACGGSDDSDDVASLTDTTGQSSTEGSGDGDSGTLSGEEREEAQLEFAQCMREHGVDFPDPVDGRFQYQGTPGDEDELEEAQEACRDILEGAFPELDEEQQAEMQDALLAFARCMREHGVDFPDPQFEEGGGALQMLPEGAEDDPNFDEAQEACQPILDDAQLGGPPPQEQDS